MCIRDSLHAALRELESITLDRRSMGLKDQMGARYADLVYEGRWWTPEREALDAMVDSLMKNVTGTIRMKLFKGNAWAVSRTAETSLYRSDLATFGASATYEHSDAEGFIRLFGLPIRAAAAAAAERDLEDALPSAAQKEQVPARSRTSAPEGLETAQRS